MTKQRSGFTLLELLIALVIVGILVAIAMPRFMEIKTKAYVTTMESDLRVLSIQEELYYKSHESYTTVASDLDGFVASPGVTVSINEATPLGWGATATHAGVPGRHCGIYMGQADSTSGNPATTSGEIACTP